MTVLQNGRAERRNRSVMDCARTMMMEKNVSQKYWREYESTIVYTLNRVQVKKGTKKSILNFGMAMHLMSIISKYLEANVTY